ncbi:hypothetical protein ACVWXU_005192 [Streptomyces sp. TE33382]
MSVRTSIEDRWAAYLWIDYLLAALAVGVHIFVIWSTGSSDWLSWIDSGQRTDLYATAAGVVSAIGGLSAIAVSLYTAANGERLRAVRAQHHEELRRSWRSLIQSTALCCLLLLISLALDRETDPLSCRFLFEYTMVFASLRFMRLVWLFDRMMQVSDADLVREEQTTTPVRDPAWLRRRERARR